MGKGSSTCLKNNKKTHKQIIETGKNNDYTTQQTIYWIMNTFQNITN